MSRYFARRSFLASLDTSNRQTLNKVISTETKCTKRYTEHSSAGAGSSPVICPASTDRVIVDHVDYRRAMGKRDLLNRASWPGRSLTCLVILIDQTVSSWRHNFLLDDVTSLIRLRAGARFDGLCYAREDVCVFFLFFSFFSPFFSFSTATSSFLLFFRPFFLFSSLSSSRFT